MHKSNGWFIITVEKVQLIPCGAFGVQRIYSYRICLQAISICSREEIVCKFSGNSFYRNNINPLLIIKVFAIERKDRVITCAIVVKGWPSYCQALLLTALKPTQLSIVFLAQD